MRDRSRGGLTVRPEKPLLDFVSDLDHLRDDALFLEILDRLIGEIVDGIDQL